MEVTWTEAVGSPARPVRLLTYVLHYDDLIDSPHVPGAELPWRLDQLPRPLTLGRAGDNHATGLRETGELRLQDRWASGVHAEIDRSGDADVVRDLGSRNGTWVNGRRVEDHRLADGDLLEVGHTLFCYRIVDLTHHEALAAAAAAPALTPTRTRCPEVAALERDLLRIARSRESVLLLGETGTGKEIAAAAVHAASGRRGAYGTVDCGAVPESLFEATFFGHRRGAFTGAADARVGEIVRADNGTLFLDEVANMSPSSQAKLLRVLEDGKVTPLGAAEAQQVDVRWVAATNRDLFADAAGFRPDLLRRLAGFVARLPPLRARREDLGVLASHLLREAGIDRASISGSAARQLFVGAFPGNVRELRTTLRAAAILAGDSSIDVSHLPVAPPAGTPAAESVSGTTSVAPGAAPPDAAKIIAVLAATGGNVVRAAQQLAAHPRQLYRWIERYNIPLDDYRQKPDK